jgi:hypothetical protein
MADSTAIVDRRPESTVAPQALFMWNHPFVLAQAKALAGRLLKGGAEDPARIRRAYALLYARPPGAEELAAGLAFLQRARAAAPPASRAPGADADGRAWEEYSVVLLCANEFMYVD